MTESLRPVQPDVVEPVELDEWHEAVSAARDTGYTFFDWLTAVDRSHDDAAPGLDVVIRVVALSHPSGSGDGPATGAGGIRGLQITTRVPEGATIASVTDVFAGAAFHERETYEMFGLVFDGFRDHTDLGLRPLLLPVGFEGHPLRKSFQLVARAVKPWPGGKEPGEGHGSSASPSRRRVQAPGVPSPEWGPR